MDDYHSIAPADFSSQKDLLALWLQRLFLCQLILAVLSALSGFAALGSVVGWLSRIGTVAIIVILFKLTPAQPRYQKAAVFKCIALAVGLLSAFLSNTLLALIISIFTLISQYQEFSAHSDITAQANPKLSKQWHTLFNWQIVVGVLGGLVASVGVVIGALAGLDASTITTFGLLVPAVLSTLISVFYLIALHKTRSLFRN